MVAQICKPKASASANSMKPSTASTVRSSAFVAKCRYGAFLETPKRSALLILSAANRLEAETLIHTDPYWIEGLVESHTITEWNPMFGSLQSRKNRFLLKLRRLARKRNKSVSGI